MILRVYIAAPKAEIRRARRVAAILRAISGVEVVSTWHRTMAPGAQDPESDTVARRILDTNLRDLRAAHILVALPCAGVGAETYAEIGRALERKIHVVISKQHGGLPLSRVDAFATCVGSDPEAVALVREIAAGEGEAEKSPPIRLVRKRGAHPLLVRDFGGGGGRSA